MPEGEPGKPEEPIKPRIIRQFKRPEEKPGTKLIPVHDDPWKRNERTGWIRVSTEPPLDLPPEMEKLSKEPPVSPQQTGKSKKTPESLEPIIGKGYVPTKRSRRKRRGKSFIEESQPPGDKD